MHHRSYVSAASYPRSHSIRYAEAAPSRNEVDTVARMVDSSGRTLGWVREVRTSLDCAALSAILPPPGASGPYTVVLVISPVHAVRGFECATVLRSPLARLVGWYRICVFGIGTNQCVHQLQSVTWVHVGPPATHNSVPARDNCHFAGRSRLDADRLARLCADHTDLTDLAANALISS
ncbi:hypothetical protein BD414DRAFT_59086 [Trametes punicea]|nr:hypothetical protein BD414DRAFT_59086 [Trametes punicea]